MMRIMEIPVRSLLMACGAGVVAVLAGPVIAFSADPGWIHTAQPRVTVAAGLGYQDAESSSITVKTYDAESGEVLTTETYELDIKDDGPPSSQPRARIFAGGVGASRDGLSEFTLRVYDAANGRFLWEGVLNFTVGNFPDGGPSLISARVEPRTVVSPVAARMSMSGQPFFVLRAQNPETGRLMWADEFSVAPAGVRADLVGRSIVGIYEPTSRDIDFRIKMPDREGRQVLWEDRILPDEDGETAASGEFDAAPGVLSPSEKSEIPQETDV